jgi:hypothetical protein
MLYPAPANSFGAGSGWAVDKVPLVMKQTFRQPLVVRGRRLDGRGDLGFSGGRGKRPFAALQFSAGGASLSVGNFHGWGVIFWVATPGCYAMQIDGTTFSSVVVFSVAFAAPSY